MLLPSLGFSDPLAFAGCRPWEFENGHNIIYSTTIQQKTEKNQNS